MLVLSDLVFFLRLRRPPRSTRTDTLFPYTTLFRSHDRADAQGRGGLERGPGDLCRTVLGDGRDHSVRAVCTAGASPPVDGSRHYLRRLCSSEERRVGKECARTCRSGWAPEHEKKKRRDTRRCVERARITNKNL